MLSTKTKKNRPQKLLIISPDLFSSQSSPDHSSQPRIDFSYYGISGPDICSLICDWSSNHVDRNQILAFWSRYFEVRKCNYDNWTYSKYQRWLNLKRMFLFSNIEPIILRSIFKRKRKCGLRLSQECTGRLVGERIVGKWGFTVENSSWLLRLFATFSFVNLFLEDWDEFDWVATSFGGKFKYSASSSTDCPHCARPTCLFGLSQSTQNVMQYVYVDVKERWFRYNSK